MVLRHPRVSDAGELASFVDRNWEFHREWEPERSGDYFTPAGQRWLLKRTRRHESRYPFVMTLKAGTPGKRSDRTIIGTIAISNVVLGFFRSCFLGYRIDHQYARQGLMSEAVTAMVDYAFDELELHRVEANCMPENEPSIGLLQKLGFVNEGTSRRYLQIQGRWRDHVHMVMLAEEWRGGKSS